MKKLLLVTTLSILFSSFHVTAKAPSSIISQCDEQELEKKAYSQCLDLVKIKIDRELETWENNQLFILEDVAETTGRQSAFNMFKRAQRNFITYRDSNCKWQFLAELPSNDSAPVYKECYILTTKDRINELSRVSK
ncbi:lysozyme inhibitor LprI family protein [Pseudocolwellia sp. HL-MZ7]|uniref:lysozyme inhibitor LprI family protein n=1 Tax=Pseudocolwellia sp. HL-MZ7 TaxID=3400627 RepID=UPI003CF26F36